MSRILVVGLVTVLVLTPVLIYWSTSLRGGMLWYCLTV